MIVYGDVLRHSTIGDVYEQTRQRLADRQADRVETLCCALVDVAMLTSALEDAGQAQALLMQALWSLGDALANAWVEPGQNASVDLPSLPQELLAQPITLRYPEGYAHYAVYPEAYWAAGRELRGRSTKVIGIRSIGLSLGVMAAVGARTRDFVSVRPTGHPFRRSVELPASWQVTTCDTVAVADEGPGLSGSSFHAAVTAACERGATKDQIILLPSHMNGPGSAASDSARDLWNTAPRLHVPFENLYLTGGQASPLAQAAASLSGHSGEIIDLSGGGWRSIIGNKPALPHREARKFLFDHDRGSVLAKFAAIGSLADIKFKRSQWLHEHGWSPPVLGLKHGFLFQSWLQDSTDIEAVSKDDYIAHLAMYVRNRTKLTTDGFGGASPDALAHMARYNVTEMLGADLSRALEPALSAAVSICSRWTPIASDNRMHKHEWRVAGGESGA